MRATLTNDGAEEKQKSENSQKPHHRVLSDVQTLLLLKGLEFDVFNAQQ